MRRQRRSRRGWWPLPLSGSALAVGLLFFPGGTGPGNDPRSSTEQIPIPYALRSARFTARVSAMRISAPRTKWDTFDGSASPKPTKRWDVLDGYTVALKTYRADEGSQNSLTAWTL